MKTTTIFDADGHVLAIIDHHTTGHAILRAPNNAVHAYYDADDDCTHNLPVYKNVAALICVPLHWTAFDCNSEVARTL